MTLRAIAFFSEDGTDKRLPYSPVRRSYDYKSSFRYTVIEWAMHMYFGDVDDRVGKL